MSLKQNDKAPNFNLPIGEGKNAKLSDYKGKNLVLYFYPKDNTPGCTTEAKDFTALHDEFKKHKTEILGVSADSLKKHENFKGKYDISYDLIADTEHELCEAYDVWKPKKMFGKEYLGVVRSTFLIDANGKIAHIWPKVKVKGHAEEVLEIVKGL